MSPSSSPFPRALLAGPQRYWRSLPVVIHGLTLAVFVNRMGGAAKAFFALYLHETRGLELTTVGLLLSLYGVGAIAGSFLMGILSDRWPARRLVVATMAVSGLSLLALALALAESVWLMASLLFVGGLMDGGFRPLTQRLIMEAAHEHVRVRVHSTVRAALNLGVGAAGLISGWLVARGYLWVFMADGAASLVSAALLWWQLRGFVPLGAGSGKAQAGQDRLPYTDGPFLLLLLSALLLALIYDQFYSTYSAYVRDAYRLSPLWIGYMYSLNGAVVVFLQIPVTLWTERLGYRVNAALGGAMIAGGFALLPFGRSAWWLTLTTLVWTLGELMLMLMPPQQALVMRRASAGRSGHYFGLYAAVWGGRGMLAPLVGTQIYVHAGADAVWYACGAAGLLAIAVQQRAIARVLQA